MEVNNREKIYVLEHFDFSVEQMDRLKSLGEVKYYEKANQFICLPYTGYDWISNINTAKENGVIISNTPNYSTNAVAEHHLGLILDCAKHLTSFNNTYKSGNRVLFNRGMELKNKKVGIIGLGSIGRRLAELLSIFNVELMTYNRTKKNVSNIKDVDLNTLLKESDIVCVTCKLTSETRNLISIEQLKLMKESAILTSTTGGIVNLDDLNEFLKDNSLFGVGLDDIDQQKVPQDLMRNDNVICKYHRAYDTNESEVNRINMCIDSIEAFLNNKPINLI